MATYLIKNGPWKGCIIDGKLIPTSMPGSYDLRGTFILYTVSKIFSSPKYIRKAYENIHDREQDWVPVFIGDIKRISPYQAARLLAAYNKANPETNWRI